MRYIVNSSTKEIHDRETKGEQCNLEGYKKADNFREVGLRELRLLIHEGFDFCDHCFGEDPR